jgi:hypothetical protein
MCEQITPAFHLSDLATWQEGRKLNDNRASIVEVYNQSSGIGSTRWMCA